MFRTFTSAFAAIALAIIPSLSTRGEDAASLALDDVETAIGWVEGSHGDYFERSNALIVILEVIDGMDEATPLDIGKFFQGDPDDIRALLYLGTHATSEQVSEVVSALRAHVASARQWLDSQLPRPSFRRGDVNSDGEVDISDVVGLLGYMFRGGSEPSCMKTADINDDGNVDISDTIALLFHLFRGGAPVSAPSGCGVDPTSDALGCEDYSHC